MEKELIVEGRHRVQPLIAAKLLQVPRRHQGAALFISLAFVQLLFRQLDLLRGRPGSRFVHLNCGDELAGPWPNTARAVHTITSNQQSLVYMILPSITVFQLTTRSQLEARPHILHRFITVPEIKPAPIKPLRTRNRSRFMPSLVKQNVNALRSNKLGRCHLHLAIVHFKPGISPRIVSVRKIMSRPQLAMVHHGSIKVVNCVFAQFAVAE